MLIFEDVRTCRRRRVGAVAGAECFVTSYAWLSGPFFLVIGLALALLQAFGRQGGPLLLGGAAYGSILFLSNLAHSAGHVLAGRMVGSPGGVVLMTATFHVNYHCCDREICTRWTHVGRSAGGPATNLLLGGIALGWYAITGSQWLDFAAKANIIIGIMLLLPIPSIDGWVIWGEMLGFRRRVPH
jgi:hypothetical protein